VGSEGGVLVVADDNTGETTLLAGGVDVENEI
jgi:hypothetical protein